MPNPGYLYLVGRTNEYGEWVKVGVAARIGRVRDHRDWNMLVQTFEAEHYLTDPRGVEQDILRRYREAGRERANCGVCGAPKPAVGRTGLDGRTEIRHLACHPGIRDHFQTAWTSADRMKREASWHVDFDPMILRPNGFTVVGEPWRQPPLMDANEYQQNTCNVICVRSIPSLEVIRFLDEEFEQGVTDLRRTLWQRFGDKVCKVDGTPTPRAKGTGVPGNPDELEAKLAQMASLADVDVVLVSVRKPGMLYAYQRNNSAPD